jgi:hypothetical protein
MSKDKEYLGDGVYIDHDDCAIILTTENGLAAENIIYLELDMVQGIAEYVERIKGREAKREPHET